MEIVSPARNGMSYADAAATVLAVQDNRTPLHYRDITDSAIAAGWLVPKGDRPELSLYAAIGATRSSLDSGLRCPGDRGWIFSIALFLGGDIIPRNELTDNPSFSRGFLEV